MPLVLSVLLTFLLNPVVNFLHRRGLARTPAVMLVVVLVSLFLSSIVIAIGQQVTSLLSELPEYRHNIRKKIADLRTAGKGSVVEKLQITVRDIIGEIQREEEAQKAQTPSVSPEGTPPASQPVPVVVEGDKSGRNLLPSAVGPLLEWIATAGLVIVLVIFMLLRQQELRNRLIRLVGHSRLSTTTKALDEAGDRISRYLLMQTVINATYGAAAGISFFLIGLPYVVLLGFLAFALRFIPYVGPWMGALLPIVLSLAIFDGWMHPLMVIGLVVGLELLTNMLLEPLLYGQSAGVSEVALIIAIAFWTWIWGPIGLVLATPLTVCCVVLCKYIPELEFVETLMGDEPVMDARIVYYQRLLAMDQDEATEVVREYLKSHPVETLCDQVFIPALSFAKRDAERNRITDRDLQFICQVTRELVDNVLPGRTRNQPIDEPEGPASRRRVPILSCAMRDEADEVGLQMFQRLIDSDLCNIEILAPGMLSSEILAAVADLQPSILCIGGLSPDPLAPTRYLCKRLREHWPDLKIIVGHWGEKSNKESRDCMIDAGADCVAVSMIEARNQTLQWIQLGSILQETIPHAGQ